MRRYAESDAELVRRLASAVWKRTPAAVRQVVDLDDLVQAGHLELLRVRERFDPSRGTPFYAFAVTPVRGAMFDLVRKAGWITRKMMQTDAARGREMRTLLSLDQPLHSEAAREVAAPALELDDTPDPTLWPWLARALATLRPRHREIVERHYLHGEPLQEIARGWGVTSSRVSQQHRDALRHLREQAVGSAA